MPCNPNKETLAFNSKMAHSLDADGDYFEHTLQFVAPGMFSYRY